MITMSVPEYFESCYEDENDYDSALMSLVFTGLVSFTEVAMSMLTPSCCVSSNMLKAVSEVTGRSYESYKDMQEKFMTQQELSELEDTNIKED